jgi:hypothetical protein
MPFRVAVTEKCLVPVIDVKNSFFGKVPVPGIFTALAL